MAPWDPTAPGSTSQQDNQGSARATTVVASGVRTTNGSGDAQIVGDADELSVLLEVTAATATLDVRVEWSHDGTTWFKSDPADAFAPVTTVGNIVKIFSVKSAYWRPVWAVSGATPSFTFAVHAQYRSTG